MTEGLTRRLGETVALDDASLQVGAGEIVGLVGANGASKSRLGGRLHRTSILHTGATLSLRAAWRAKPLATAR